MALVASALNMPIGVFAAAQGSTLGGTAKDAAQKNLPGVKVQVRMVNPPPGTPSIVATGTTNGSGAFSFAGINPGSYVVEIVNAAGEIVGTSAAVTVAAGTAVTVTITAAAAGAIAGAAAGGAGLLGLGTLGTVAVIGGATAAAIVATQATGDEGSPSR